MTIIAYPRSGIAYVDELYRAVGALGVEVVEGQWAGRWVMRHIRRGDLVHMHWPSFAYYQSGKPFATFYNLLKFGLLLLMMRANGARLVWTAHNLYPHDGGRQRWSHRMARRIITRMCETIFVHSPTAATLIIDEFHVAPRKLVGVPHGHWRTAYPDIPDRATARRRIGLPEDAFTYGFVGACRPYKSIEFLAQAFGAMDRDTHLLIAGEFASPQYRQLVCSGIGMHARDRVHLTERFLRDEEIMTYVAALDALVLPYRQILTSGAVMLGLSAGVPVVAPRMGGIADVVTEK
jgi:glycosyltransferase involved in cell wall biosynthesis